MTLDTMSALAQRPWTSVDGPAVVKAAAALQLLEINRRHTVLLHRLAAVGSLLPSRPGAPALSASKLRTLLKTDVVSRAADDFVETDLFCSQIALRQQPFRSLSGIRDNATAIAEYICDVPLSLAGEHLPPDFARQMNRLAFAMCELSEEMCRRAGISRSKGASSEVDSSKVTVPSTARIRELEAAVTFAQVDRRVQRLIERLGEVAQMHGKIVPVEDEELANRMMSRPLLITDSELVVALPGELASAAAMWVVDTAVLRGCETELGRAVRRYSLSRVGEMLSVSGFELLTVTESDDANGAVIATRVDQSNSVAFVIVGDDFDTYSATGSDGLWDLQSQVDKLVSDGSVVAEASVVVFVTVGAYRSRAVLVPADSTYSWVSLDVHNLLMVLRLAWADNPLGLVRFARACQRLERTTRVLSASELGLLALYQDNEESFYLSDERLPDMLVVEDGAELRFRTDERRRFDYHAWPMADGSAMEAYSQFGLDWSPIYVVNDAGATTARLIENRSAKIWVRGIEVEDQLVDMCAYWLWQLANDAEEHGWSGNVETLKVAIRMVPDGDKGMADAFNFRRVGTDQWTLTVNAEQFAIDPMVPNAVDREFVTALLENVGGWFRIADAAATLARIAPPGMKRMLTIGSGALWERYDEEVANSARLVAVAVNSELLDQLGELLFADSNRPVGPFPASETVRTLNDAVARLMGLLTEEVRLHSAPELLGLLIRQSEAIETKKYLDGLRRSARIACYGAELYPVDEVAKESNRLMEAALANRFLIEFVSATQPAGAAVVTRDSYDRMLALASEIVFLGMLSDASHYQLSHVELSRLESGRLGIQRDDAFFHGTTVFSNAQMERDLGELPNQFEIETADFWDFNETEDTAWIAEFGFRPIDLRDVVAWIFGNYQSSGQGHVVAISKKSMTTDLARHFEWEIEQAARLIDLLSIGPVPDYQLNEAYRPWRYGRERSYVRRPVVVVHEGEEPLLVYSRTRLLGAVGDRIHEYRSGRLVAKTAKMRSVAGAIREQQTLAYELEVGREFRRLGFDIVRNRVKKFGSTRITGDDRNTLGDIDALAVDVTSKLIVVAEAKDYESARTPVEISREMKRLTETAVVRNRRRAEWVRQHIEVVLKGLALEVEASGWTVRDIVVTNRLSLAVLTGNVAAEVVHFYKLEEWAVEARAAPRGDSGRRGPRLR